MAKIFGGGCILCMVFERVLLWILVEGVVAVRVQRQFADKVLT